VLGIKASARQGRLGVFDGVAGLARSVGGWAPIPLVGPKRLGSQPGHVGRTCMDEMEMQGGGSLDALLAFGSIGDGSRLARTGRAVAGRVLGVSSRAIGRGRVQSWT
jgi:hypothetical protein